MSCVKSAGYHLVAGQSAKTKLTVRKDIGMALHGNGR